MKKLFALLLIGLIVDLTAYSQNITPQRSNFNATNIQFSHDIPDFGGIRQLDCDTFGNLIPCDTAFFIWTFGPGTGFLSGHNVFLDKAKAEKYTIAGDSIKGLWVWFAYAHATSSSSKVTFKIWDDNGVGGTPGTVLATKAVPIQTIATNVADTVFTTVYFTNPIANPGTFYAGFALTYSGGVFDSLNAVALPNPDLTDPCSGDTGRNTAWEEYSDNSWHTYVESYGIGTTNPIFPLVCNHCTLAVSASANTICKKKTSTLTASGGNGTYSWTPAAGLNTTTGASVIAKPAHTTTYTVHSGDCTATITITVNPVPAVQIAAAPCSGGAVLLTCNSNPNTGISRQWYYGSTLIPGATNQTYSAPASGTYKCKVTITSTGCNTTGTKAVTVGCRMADAGLSFAVNAYPNPFVNSINLSITSATSDAATVSLMDFTGRTLHVYTNVDVTNTFVIDEPLASGIYFIKVDQGSNQQLIKVIKN